MMPSYPAFVLLIASLPFLVPGVPRRLRVQPAPPRTSARTGWIAVATAILITALVPLAAVAAASPRPVTDRATLNATPMPVPANVDIGLTAAVRGTRVELNWHGQHPAGGPVFYRIWRARTSGFTCPASTGAPLCVVAMPEVGVTRRASTFVDHAPRGAWYYRVAVGANWLDNPQYGDPYLVSRTVAVTIK
jgi:hypothetical protein